MKQIEVWGNLSCTFKRINDSFVDEMNLNGHHERIEDLDLIRDLRVKKLHYPCLWEKTAPESLDRCDWSFLDERLPVIKNSGIDIIANLLHHGGGPRYTSLIDPEFPEKFATFARHFATRYPWITDYSPITDINTTARYSTLDGHWYPHLESELMYYKALILQCKATSLAMKEIRIVNPKAQWIQSEDLSHGPWIALDLLSGRLNSDLIHKMLKAGIKEKELAWFEDYSSKPDMISINLNFFDEELIKKTWDRFYIPMSLAYLPEGHRETQLRTLDKIWTGAQKVNQEGSNILSVTVGNLLGTHDWQCDLYSSGVFNIANAKSPAKTVLADMIEALAETGTYDSPVLNSESQTLLITGSANSLGQSFARICESRNIPFKLVDGPEINIEERSSIERVIEKYKPWGIIHSDIENETSEALAMACRFHNLKHLSFSNKEHSETLSIYPESLILRVSPLTFVPDLVNDSLNQMIDGERGFVHQANVSVMPFEITQQELHS